MHFQGVKNTDRYCIPKIILTILPSNHIISNLSLNYIGMCTHAHLRNLYSTETFLKPAQEDRSEDVALMRELAQTRKLPVTMHKAVTSVTLVGCLAQRSTFALLISAMRWVILIPVSHTRSLRGPSAPSWGSPLCTAETRSSALGSPGACSQPPHCGPRCRLRGSVWAQNRARGA